MTILKEKSKKTAKDVAENLVKKYNTLPSKRFGDIVTEVDQDGISAHLRKIRLSKDVTATAVGEVMGLSRCDVHLLETGSRRWTLEKLTNYISALNKLTMDKRSKRESA